MRLSFLGDVYLDRPYQVALDLVQFVFNLESPLSTRGIPAKGKINLGAEKPYIEETFGKLPVAVSLANNHIMDYGEEAFGATVDYLDRNSIKYFGAGREENNFNNPALLDIDGNKIALLGYCCPTTHPVFGGKRTNGSARLDERKVIGDIQACKEDADMIILFLHWGEEEMRYPRPDDVRKARKFVDAGADLVLGHHAHVIQSFETYRGKHIFYGLGNFIFPEHEIKGHYDGEAFKKRRFKKQYRANKQTLIVELDDRLDIVYKTAYFDGEAIKTQQVNLPHWIPEKQTVYNLYRIFRSKEKMLEMFFAQPRIPTTKQIKLFFGLKG
jgi:poly-gamma-glutamate capsule biosynthesis protein CapA/YwtB (metallophosphatase superfamily)